MAMFRHTDPVAWSFHRNTSRWLHNLVVHRGTENPEPAKEYPDAPLLSLPEPSFPPVPLAQTLATRLSCRHFAFDGLEHVQLATLLAAGYGVRGRVELQGAEFLERPVPSGGGLYPLELYALVRSVDGLEPGMYHYAPLVHGLEALAVGPAPPGLLGQLFLGQPYVSEAAVVVLLSAVVDRLLKKYGDRGYRYILFEAGHVAQNVNLTAAALGLGSCNLGGFFDDDVAGLLGLDVEEEIPLYGVAIGVPAVSAVSDLASLRTPGTWPPPPPEES